METRSRAIQLDDGTQITFEHARLVVAEGPDQGLEHPLRDQPVVVGRSQDCDLSLADGAVSREHFVLEPCEGGWKVRDLGSKSGTRIQGVRITEGFLEPGSTVEVGTTKLTLRTRELALRAPMADADTFEGLYGASRAMRALFGLVRQVAPFDLPVLMVGESGTGKEGLARALHNHSTACAGPYEVVDCTVLGEGEHLRSELFGHVKGAFTGAVDNRVGAFERANGGTLFLDEIGELPLELQPQLLRVLEAGELRPLGGTRVVRTRVRVVSATNRDLGAMVREGTFRRDLYYRLSAMTIDVPPLRERDDDVLLLARRFLPPALEFDADARAALVAHPWPGNVRELRNVIARATALAGAGPVTPGHLRLQTGEVSYPGGGGVRIAPGGAPMGAPAAAPPAAAPPAGDAAPARPPAGPGAAGDSPSLLETYEERAIREALARFDGDKNKAAEFLGVSRATLYRRLKRMRER